MRRPVLAAMIMRRPVLAAMIMRRPILAAMIMRRPILAAMPSAALSEPFIRFEANWRIVQ